MTHVIDNEIKQRFELEDDGHVAELVYRRSPGELVLVHTGVPEELGGRGIGGQLVQAALDEARERNLRVVAQCEFARGWIEKHPDAAAGIEVSA